MSKNTILKMNSNCNGLCCTKIENFGVQIGSNKILEDVNIHIHCGEITTIIGPNGAGKSTLIKAILGEINHTGTLKYLGENTTEYKTPIIGYVPQVLSYDHSSPISVLDLFTACNTKIPVWIYSSKKFRTRVIDSLVKVKAEHLIDRKLGALSGGELQRVLLALALDPMPNILILDEPVSGIDQSGLAIFYNLLTEIKRKYDLAIILVSHDLDLVSKYSDRVVLLKRTVICSGTPAQVFNNEETQNIFGLGVLRKGDTKHA